MPVVGKVKLSTLLQIKPTTLPTVAPVSVYIKVPLYELSATPKNVIGVFKHFRVKTASTVMFIGQFALFPGPAQIHFAVGTVVSWRV